MDPDSTTTMGEGESDTTERPFQSMNAVERTSAKLSSCVASCRGCMFARPIIFAAGSGGLEVVCSEWNQDWWGICAMSR